MQQVLIGSDEFWCCYRSAFVITLWRLSLAFLRNWGHRTLLGLLLFFLARDEQHSNFTIVGEQVRSLALQTSS